MFTQLKTADKEQSHDDEPTAGVFYVVFSLVCTSQVGGLAVKIALFVT